MPDLNSLSDDDLLAQAKQKGISLPSEQLSDDDLIAQADPYNSEKTFLTKDEWNQSAGNPTKRQALESYVSSVMGTDPTLLTGPEREEQQARQKGQSTHNAVDLLTNQLKGTAGLGAMAVGAGGLGLLAPEAVAMTNAEAFTAGGGSLPEAGGGLMSRVGQGALDAGKWLLENKAKAAAGAMGLGGAYHMGKRVGGFLK